MCVAKLPDFLTVNPRKPGDKVVEEEHRRKNIEITARIDLKYSNNFVTYPLETREKNKKKKTRGSVQYTHAPLPWKGRPTIGSLNVMSSGSDPCRRNIILDEQNRFI